MSVNGAGAQLRNVSATALMKAFGVSNVIRLLTKRLSGVDISQNLRHTQTGHIRWVYGFCVSTFVVQTKLTAPQERPIRAQRRAHVNGSVLVKWCQVIVHEKCVFIN